MSVSGASRTSLRTTGLVDWTSNGGVIPVSGVTVEGGTGHGLITTRKSWSGLPSLPLGSLTGSICQLSLEKLMKLGLWIYSRLHEVPSERNVK